METLEKWRAARLVLFVVATLAAVLAVWSVVLHRPPPTPHRTGLSSFQVAHLRLDRTPSTAVASSPADTAPVGEPALAGSDPMRNAMNASREAQRMASVEVDGVLYQALGYVRDPDRKVVVAVRNDRGNDNWTDWQAYVYDGTDGLPDLGTVDEDIHNWVSVGFDAGGTLHLSWDMHNDPLAYRRSTTPVDRWEGVLTNDLSMLGTNEDRVTYVRFHLLEETLYVTFRNGVSGDGDWFFYVYDAQQEAWSAGPGLADTDGRLLDGTSDDQNPYLFRDPSMDGEGNIHFAWNWRATPDVATNHQVEYMQWNGSAYVTTEGTTLSVPLREGDAETVDASGPNEGLDDFGALAVDAAGHPHLAYRKNGPDGHMQMFHFWHDGTAWQSTSLTETDYPSYYALTDDGGMYLSGAAIAPFADGTVAILFTDEEDDNHLAAWTADAPFQSWSKTIVYDGHDLGYYEPGVDRRTLRERDRLFIPITPWRNSDPADGWPIFVVEALGTTFEVELARFDAAIEDSIVRLSWETASEARLAGFDVERRSDGGAFEAIGFVEASGAVDTPQSYEFVDTELPSRQETLTYRLKFIGDDGTFDYSSTVRVALLEEEVRLLGNYPNPVHERTTILYEIAQSGLVRLTLFNVAGQKVRTLVGTHREAGRHQVEFDVRPLASGIYLLRLDAHGHSAEGRITVAR